MKESPGRRPPDSIPRHWFQRFLFTRTASVGPSACIYGFSVHFPGRTPQDAKRWLKARGYVYHGGDWSRADRRPSRLTLDQFRTHQRRVLDRQRRRGLRGRTSRV